MRDLLLELVQVTVGKRDRLSRVLSEGEWKSLRALASGQGLVAFLTDGFDRLPLDQVPPEEEMVHWIGDRMRKEAAHSSHWKAQCALADLLKKGGLKTLVLKGEVFAECWPNSERRSSSDMDCFLLGADDAWEQGNRLVEAAGYEVQRTYYKNSTWLLPKLMVENHRWLTPFRGNKRLMALERLLQRLMREDQGSSRFAGTELWRPPVMASAIFLIEHAYSHFLHEGLTWRLILDWPFYLQAHSSELDMTELAGWIDLYGFRKFFTSYVQLGKYCLGLVTKNDLSDADKLMLSDVWAPQDLHETVDGLRGKLALVGNTWRARWKYRKFTDMNWMQALWIQVNGYLFEKDATL